MTRPDAVVSGPGRATGPGRGGAAPVRVPEGRAEQSWAPARSALLATLLVAVAACSACTSRGDGSAGLEKVPVPDLGTADPLVREQLGAERRRLEAAIAEQQPAPDLAEAYGRMGRYYHAYDLLEPAESCYRNARRLAPGDRRWAYYLGAVELRRGRPEAAAQEFRAALDLAPDDAAILLRLGEAELAAGRPEAARPVLAAALERDSGCVAALYRLGEAARELGELEAAAGHFKEVLARQPTAEQVHYPLALVLIRLDRRAEAQRHLRRSSEREVSVGGRPACPDPLDAELGRLVTGATALVRRGLVAANAGQPELALDLYRRAVALAPDDSLARQSFGSALLAAGRADEAREQYEAAVRLEPERPDLMSDLGGIDLVQGRYADAERRFRAALGLDPESVRVRLQLANTLRRTDRCAEAVPLQDGVLAQEPGNRVARIERALCLAALGRRSAAADDLGYLIDVEPPDDPAERLQVASFLLSLGDFERAGRHFVAIAGSDAPPEVRARAHLMLGRQRQAQGDLRAAAASYEAALALAPGLEEARQALASTLRD